MKKENIIFQKSMLSLIGNEKKFQSICTLKYNLYKEFCFCMNVINDFVQYFSLVILNSIDTRSVFVEYI